jgi:hypothetical protein
VPGFQGSGNQHFGTPEPRNLGTSELRNLGTSEPRKIRIGSMQFTFRMGRPSMSTDTQMPFGDTPPQP